MIPCYFVVFSRRRGTISPTQLVRFCPLQQGLQQGECPFYSASRPLLCHPSPRTHTDSSTHPSTYPYQVIESFGSIFQEQPSAIGKVIKHSCRSSRLFTLHCQQCPVNLASLHPTGRPGRGGGGGASSAFGCKHLYSDCGEYRSTDAVASLLPRYCRANHHHRHHLHHHLHHHHNPCHPHSIERNSCCCRQAYRYPSDQVRVLVVCIYIGVTTLGAGGQ